MDTLPKATVLGSTPVQPWPPPPREPLPPWPLPTGSQPAPPRAECWSANGDYKTALSSPFPKERRRDIVRGSFYGVKVPGYTSGDGVDPEMVMTWQLPWNTPEQMQLAVNYYADVAGYTDIVLSIPQTFNGGKTIDDLIRVALYCQSKGLNIHVAAVSDGNPFSWAIPYLDQMVTAGALVPNKDTVIACWQIDKWYQPGAACDLLNDGAPYANARGLMFGPHWGGGYEGWAENYACWDDDTEASYGVHDRWSFQSWFARICNAPIHYGQCNIDADVDAVQSWVYKAVVAMPAKMICCVTEMSQQGQFWYLDWPEIYGDLKTRIAMASQNPNGVRLAYMGGGRETDGSVL